MNDGGDLNKGRKEKRGRRKGKCWWSCGRVALGK
jgi:hypothetical protein